jgi:hypothetical protein
VEVSGRLTKNGVGWDPLPELQFVLRDGIEDDSRYGRSVVSLGGGAFKISLPRAIYDPRLFFGRTQIVNEIVPGGLKVSGPTELDIDFKTVVVSGEVSWAGGAFPPGESNLGSVCLRETEDDSNNYCAEVSRGSPATFAIEVPRGRVHEISWSRGGSIASDAPLNELPYGQQTFEVRAFDQDTTVDLDVTAPSLVLTGSVASDGTPVSELTPRPMGFIEVSPVTINLAETGPSTFQVRLLSGTYSPLAYLIATNGAFQVLKPCADAGCVWSKDTDLKLDLVTRTAVVAGGIEFVDVEGRPVPASTIGAGGLVRLEPVPAGATAPPATPAPGALVEFADAAQQFRFERVPFGSYSVSFSRSSSGAGAFGIYRFDGVLLVDREEVSWRQAATVASTVIEVTVNRAPMPDDAELEGEPRGELTLFEYGRKDPRNVNGVRLQLGETGPARFEQLLLQGRYRATLSAQTALGRTHLRGLKESVLPFGRLDLPSFQVDGTAPTLSFDVAVREVSLSVRNTDLLAHADLKANTVVSLTSADGHAFWVHPEAPDAQVSLRVYAGCYKVAALPTEVPYYPDSDAHEQEVPIGTLCTCDQ